MCGHSNVRLTTAPVLMLWGSQGYLWLPYDLTEVIKLIGETFEPKKNFFFHVIPSILLSFLPDYCHSFRIIVIPSILVSFLPNYCHSFRITVIPSKLLPFQIFVILNSSSTLPYPKGEKNGHRRWPYMRVLLIFSHFTHFSSFFLIIPHSCLFSLIFPHFSSFSLIFSHFPSIFLILQG